MSLQLESERGMTKRTPLRDEPSASLYLQLMKKTLSFVLWEEPGTPIDLYAHRLSFLKRMFVRFLSSCFAAFDLQVVNRIGPKPADRIDGKIWPLYADTMIGLKRLDNIQSCIEDVIRNDVPGDLIETGVWRGGSAIFMKAVLAAYRITNRRIFVADSFQGLPPPDTAKHPRDRGDTHYKERFLAVSQDAVKRNFEKYGLLDEQVVFLPGWFKDTLPVAPIESLAVMRLDGDMYGSTMDALTSLYPKLSKGGYCIIDDYALQGCKNAVDDFRDERHIMTPLVRIDWSGVFWQKG
jgi:O-methyltransferase